MFLMAYISIKEKYMFQKVNAGKPPNIIHLSYSEIVRKSKKLRFPLPSSLFYSYYFRRCSSELAELVPVPHTRVRFIHYFNTLYDFSVTNPRCYKDVYVNSFFPRTAGL